LKKEIIQAEEISAYAYKRSLLEKALQFNINEKLLILLKYDLVKTLYKLSDYKLTLERIYKLTSEKMSNEDKNQIEKCADDGSPGKR
jgi:hypothetical protein